MSGAGGGVSGAGVGLRAHSEPKTSTGRRTQAERREQTRRRLTEAALRSIAEIGYHATTFPEVVRRAGLSNGALWRHFPTKTELMVATALHCEEILAEEAATHRLDGMRPDRRIDAAVKIVWDWAHTPALEALMDVIGAARSDEDLRSALRAHDSDAARTFFGAFGRLVGPELEASPGFEPATRALGLLLYGVALTSQLRSPAADRRLRAEVQGTVRGLFGF